jgi:hypothetical protein
MSKAPSAWKNRIVEVGEADPRALEPNPRNWRKHPQKQREAVHGAITELGWLIPVIVNRTTGRLVDGHLRVSLAAGRGDPTVPVAYVELTEAEELAALASIDPLGDLARRDSQGLRELIEQVTVTDDELATFLQQVDRWAASDIEGTAENRGKTNNQKGAAFEDELANKLDGERTGGAHDGGRDVDTDAYAIQAKVGSSYFPKRLYDFLTAIPTRVGQGRALIVGDDAEPGEKRRAVVVIELERWRQVEALGADPFANPEPDK